MNSDVKRMWVDALLSGDYTQGSSALHNMGDNSYCCLGVLCVLAEEQGVTEGAPSMSKKHTAWDKETMTPPVSVRAWAGLADANPMVVWGDRVVGLAQVNDNYQQSFQQIARIIEEQL